jgi:phage baseplate assembly protein W
MQTLALVHGDLVIDGTGNYALYSGVNRIRQDLTLALTEEYGSDHFHPLWGSIVTSYLGNPITANLQQLVKAEVNRVVQNYLTLQQSSVLRNTTYDIQGVYDTSDVVQSVDNISVSTAFDSIYVSASLTTVDRQTVTINRQVGT